MIVQTSTEDTLVMKQIIIIQQEAGVMEGEDMHLKIIQSEVDVM